MLNFLLFDGAKLRCNNRNAKKKHFARLAKEDYNEFVKPNEQSSNLLEYLFRLQSNGNQYPSLLLSF